MLYLIPLELEEQPQKTLQSRMAGQILAVMVAFLMAVVVHLVAH
jgi:hypothetical protein